MKQAVEDEMPISGDAINLMRQYIREQIIKKTKEAKELFRERNKLRKVQGLKKKIRLSDEYLKKVLNDDKKNN